MADVRPILHMSNQNKGLEGHNVLLSKKVISITAAKSNVRDLPLIPNQEQEWLHSQMTGG